jgi:hypothetical protein
MIAGLAAAHGGAGSASGLSTTVSISRKCPRWTAPGLCSRAFPAILDLDKLGTGCNLVVDVSRELDLIAGSREALCGIRATSKYFLQARHRHVRRVRRVVDSRQRLET